MTVLHVKHLPHPPVGSTDGHLHFRCDLLGGQVHVQPFPALARSALLVARKHCILHACACARLTRYIRASCTHCGKGYDVSHVRQPLEREGARSRVGRGRAHPMSPPECRSHDESQQLPLRRVRAHEAMRSRSSDLFRSGPPTTVGCAVRVAATLSRAPRLGSAHETAPENLVFPYTPH